MYHLQLLVFTTVITLLLLAGPGVCLPVVTSENNVQVLHRKLEALTKNSTLLSQLQKLFLFNPTPKACYDTEVIIEVGTLNGEAQSVFHKCTYNNYECEYGNWTAHSDCNYAICPGGLGEFQTSRLLLSYSSLLQALHPLFYNMITTFSTINRDTSSRYDSGSLQYRPAPDITLRLFIDTIDVLPLHHDDLSEAVMIFLSLVSKIDTIPHRGINIMNN